MIRTVSPNACFLIIIVRIKQILDFNFLYLSFKNFLRFCLIMDKKKIFVLLPDGVGLRNFAYSKFCKLGVQQGFDVVFWNNTPFNLTDLGFQEVIIDNPTNHPFTEIYKNARKHIELNLFEKRFNDATFNSYRFPFSKATFKQKVKTFLTKKIIQKYNSEEKLERLKEKILKFETQTDYFKKCVATLKAEKPAVVFCTNQRPPLAIAPIEAAKSLGIPTATFIFSWDNLPKATILIETDYYFVWSDYMKNELLKYYPHVKENQIFITGTPQFENHFDETLKQNKEAFFAEHNLDLHKKYICYSGDDIATSPNDPFYLEDAAKAIQLLNSKGYNLGLIFRRCPVDFSTRFDLILDKYKDVIVPIAPAWINMGRGWNSVLPTKRDMFLQTNTIAHSEFVINLGSSMVFDYLCYQKPCVYINYDIPESNSIFWNVEKIYNYIHFRSMPSNKSVIWFEDRDKVSQKIIEALENSDHTVNNAKKWFEKINGNTPESCSLEIWKSLKAIVNARS